MVIGLLAIVAIGVLVIVFMQPRRGTVEYYRKEFRAARNEMFGVKWYTPITRRMHNVLRIDKPQRQRALSFSESDALQKRANAARDELIKLGYLAERTFTVSNRSAGSVLGDVVVSARRVIPDETGYYTCFLQVQSNVIVLAAAPADLPKWEELIRKADVP